MSGTRKPSADTSWFSVHVDRQRLEAAIDLYLDFCYRRREAAHVSEFARSLELARPHVSQVLKRVFGRPAKEVFRDRQLAYAEKLLRDTSMSIDEIALAAAFGTPPTFYRVFRMRHGTTPGEYRNDLTNC